MNTAEEDDLAAAEAQFLSLLWAASASFTLDVHLFAFPEPSRTQPPRDSAGQPYLDASELFGMPLDAMIVTGREPRARPLHQDPFQRRIAVLADWATSQSVAAIWSCRAAHAAVRHLDGIAGVPYGEKLTGLFECRVVNRGGPVGAGLPFRWVVPHARWNDLPGDVLVSKGYRIISASPEAGVDVFTKDFGAPFFFFQGHPEFEAGTLVRQFLQEVARFAEGRSCHFPPAPAHCFTPATTALLDAVRARALSGEMHHADVELTLGAVEDAGGVAYWRPPAVTLVRDFLCLSARRPAPPPVRTAAKAPASNGAAPGQA